MPLYNRPDFIQRQSPEQARLMPTPQADQTAGILAGGARDMGSFLQKMHDQKVKSAMDKMDMQKAISEMEKAKFENDPENMKAKTDLLKAQAGKAMQETQDAKDKAENLNKYIASLEPATTTTTTPEALPPIAQSDIPMPQDTEQKQSRNIEKDIQDDPMLQQAIKSADFSLRIDKSMNPTEYNSAILKARKDVGKVHVSAEFQNQMDATRPENYEDAAKLLRSIPGANKYVDRGDQEELLKSFQKKADIQKATLAAASAERAVTAAERQVTQQGVANERANKAFNQTQNVGLGDDIDKGQYVVATDAYNAINNSPVLNDNDPVKFKALKGLAASVDGGGSSVIGAIMNTAARIPVVSWVLPGGIEDIKLRQAQDALDKDKAVQDMLLDPEFQAFTSDLFTLVNADLKKASGSAVTAPEMSRFMKSIGLSVWDGDIGKLRVAMDKYGKRLDANLKLLGRKYPEADKSLIPVINGFEQKNEAGPVDAEAPKTRDSRKSGTNPLGLKL